MASSIVLVRALAVVAVVSAFRHYDDDAAREHLALEVKSNRSRATTPRLSAEDRAELREDRKAQAKAKLPSGSLIQKETCEDAKFVQTGEKLGEGAFGAVYKVRSNTWLGTLSDWSEWFESAGEYFAMKVPLEGDEEAEDAAEHEVSVMKAAAEHKCHHVLPLLEKDPCVDGEKKINAFVTVLLPWDMEKWQQYEIPAKCYDIVFDAIRSGLDCMHEAGYMHGDLKPDNVLFADFDEDDCPTGIQLADFGLSHKLNTPHLKFPKEYYKSSWHEAGTVFNGAKDPFKLTKRIKVKGKYKMHYMVDKRLDECSFAMLMYELFGKGVPSIQKELGKGACGPMGEGRKLVMP